MAIQYKFIILSAMFFCHILADYILAKPFTQLKQFEWWKENMPKMCSEDYKMVLFEHAYIWSFFMSSPLLVVALINDSGDALTVLLCSYIVNTCGHAVLDDLTINGDDYTPYAGYGTLGSWHLNLIASQALRMMQVLLTWVIVMGCIVPIGG